MVFGLFLHLRCDLKFIGVASVRTKIWQIRGSKKSITIEVKPLQNNERKGEQERDIHKHRWGCSSLHIDPLGHPQNQPSIPLPDTEPPL